MNPGGESTASKKDERRIIRRSKRRLTVRFGIGKTDRTAFTRNISESGLFVQTHMALKPGTTIQVEIKFPDRQFCHLARVIWARQVPAQLAGVVEGGMGVCFIEPSPEWLEFYRVWARKNGLE